MYFKFNSSFASVIFFIFQHIKSPDTVAKCSETQPQINLINSVLNFFSELAGLIQISDFLQAANAFGEAVVKQLLLVSAHKGHFVILAGVVYGLQSDLVRRFHGHQHERLLKVSLDGHWHRPKAFWTAPRQIIFRAVRKIPQDDFRFCIYLNFKCLRGEGTWFVILLWKRVDR